MHFPLLKFRGVLVAVHFHTLNFTNQLPNVGSLMGSCSTYSRVPFCVNADKSVQSELVFLYNAYTRSLLLSDTHETIT